MCVRAYLYYYNIPHAQVSIWHNTDVFHLIATSAEALWHLLLTMRDKRFLSAFLDIGVVGLIPRAG